MSFTPAKKITSSQTTIHESLEKALKKYAESPFKKPIAEHTLRAFDAAYGYWQQGSFDAVFLDSACGTAESTRYLAEKNPNTLVIGIDQSAKRLSHSANQHLPVNCLVLRCDCTDFWRLAKLHAWYFQFHSLYYPNPYPKADDLKKRWHGHPAFAALCSTSEQIELRTNWKIYAEEFSVALYFLTGKKPCLNTYYTDQPITAFERKYLKSGHELWQVVSD